MNAFDSEPLEPFDLSVFIGGQLEVDYYDARDLSRFKKGKTLYYFIELATGYPEHIRMAKSILKDIDRWGVCIFYHNSLPYYVVRKNVPPPQALS